MNRLSQFKISPVYNSDEDVKIFNNNFIAKSKSAYFNGGILCV